MIIYSQKYYNKYHQIVKHYKDLNLKKSKNLYTESHHIIPKSMGGSDSKENLVRIPARVHFLLHWILYRIYKTPSMIFAWHMMCNDRYGNRYNSKSWEYARQNLSKYMKTTKLYLGRTHSEETRKKLSLAGKGKNKSKEHARKIGDAHIGMKRSHETKMKISAAAKNRSYGPVSAETKKKMSMWIRTEETRSKMSAANRKRIRPIQICPHCNKSGTVNMNRYHFDKCKTLLYIT